MKCQLNYQKNKPLSQLSTFGIGGPAKYFVEVKNSEDVKGVLSFCKENTLPYLVIGKGSNILFDDAGYNGVVILNKIDFLNSSETGTFHVGAGYSFSLLGTQTARKGWSGLEFASGIPGSVGGAVFMNAGANGQETFNTLVSVDFIDEFANEHCFPKEQLSYSYRTSTFQKMQGVITGATFQLAPDGEARKKQIGIIEYRTQTQPYGEKSAGCIFRNPHSSYAGAVIEQCGLKGVKVGGAMVSDMHANFIVNTGQATAQDVLKLVKIIQAHVQEKLGVSLEHEVRYIPYKEKDD